MTAGTERKKKTEKNGDASAGGLPAPLVTASLPNGCACHLAMAMSGVSGRTSPARALPPSIGFHARGQGVGWNKPAGRSLPAGRQVPPLPGERGTSRTTLVPLHDSRFRHLDEHRLLDSMGRIADGKKRREPRRARPGRQEMKGGIERESQHALRLAEPSGPNPITFCTRTRRQGWQVSGSSCRIHRGTRERMTGDEYSTEGGFGDWHRGDCPDGRHSALELHLCRGGGYLFDTTSGLCSDSSATHSTCADGRQ